MKRSELRQLIKEELGGLNPTSSENEKFLEYLSKTFDLSPTHNGSSEFKLSLKGAGRIYFTPQDKDGIFNVRAVTCSATDERELIKLGFLFKGRSWVAGEDTYYKNANNHPVALSISDFNKLINIVQQGFKRYAKSFADFYRGRIGKD